MKTKIVAALVAALTIGTVVVSGTSQAQAHHWGHGWGWGGLGLGLALGAASAYPADCYLSPRYDRFGNVIRYVKVCNY